MREVLRSVRLQLDHNAEQDAEYIGGEPGQWVRKTQSGEGAPEMWVYFSLTDDAYRLEYLVLPGFEPPTEEQDQTIL